MKTALFSRKNSTEQQKRVQVQYGACPGIIRTSKYIFFADFLSSCEERKTSAQHRSSVFMIRLRVIIIVTIISHNPHAIFYIHFLLFFLLCSLSPSQSLSLSKYAADFRFVDFYEKNSPIPLEISCSKIDRCP